MKVHYVVRRSEPLRPRVMRRLPVRGRRSVGAGLRRRGIELRNQPSGASTLCHYGEDNTVRTDRRGAYRPTESETLCMRRSSMRGSRESPEATERELSPVGEGLWPQSQRVRDRAVGQAHSTREAVEQRSSTGKTGHRPAEMVEERGTDRGELVQVQHTPDAEPEGAIWRTLRRARSGKPRIHARGCACVEPTCVCHRGWSEYGRQRDGNVRINASALSTRGRSRMR